MLNSDTAFIFLKPISVIVPVVAVKASPKAIPTSTIRFLPEGGDWVAGLNNTMAFKVTNAKEMPVEASGFIKDNAGAKVAEFRTLLHGMGTE